MKTQNNIVEAQIEKKIPWNKAHLKNNTKKISIKLWLVLLVLSGFVFSLLFLNLHSNLNLHTQPDPLSPSDLREQAWLKKTLNLATIPYDPNYIDKNNIDSNPHNEDSQIEVNKDETLFLETTTLPQSMLIQHAPDKYIELIKDRHSSNE